MANASTEQRELALVEKVDLRILNVANNEAKLQQLLGTYLPPLLLKGGSEHASVRAKVISICQRLKTFIQPPGVVLPVAALLEQYKTTDSPVVKHLDMMFVQHSIGRLEAPDRRKLISTILRSIGSETSNTAALFNVFLQVLRDLRIPPRGSKEDEALRDDVGLSDAKDAKFVAEWLGKLLLLKPQKDTTAPCPGLTSSDVAFLTLGKSDTWVPTAPDGLSLPETRIKSITFIASGAFKDDERFIPALYAASSSDSRVSSIGDDLLKRSTVSLEDKGLVETLFEAHSRLPAAYRIRILNLLSRSAISTGFTGQILEAVRRDIKIPSDEQGAGASLNATGLELTKIHKALFEYINWVARIGPGKGTFEIGSALVDLLRDYINEQGWPKPIRQSLDDTTLRSRAYETIGVLAKGTNMSHGERLSLVGWLFRSLSEDPTPDVVVNIDGALSSLTSLFQPGENSNVLRQILLTYMTMPDDEGSVIRSARHAATKWANQTLLFSDSTARWIDILAIAGRRDERSDVVEEGHKGLDPWTYRVNDDKNTGLPDWKEMVHAFFKEPITHLNTSEWSQGRSMDVDGLSIFANFPGDRLKAFPVAVTYCKRMLFLAALKDFKIEPGWERQLEAQVQSDKKTREAIRAYLKTVNGSDILDLLTAAFEGMLRDNPAIAEECARCFVEVISFTPKAVVGELASRALELIPLIRSNKKELRSLGARAFGITAPHPANKPEFVAQAKDALVALIKPWKSAVGSELNAAEGSFLSLGYLVSRASYYPSPSLDTLSNGLAELIPSPKDIKAASLSFQEAIFDTLSQIWTAGFTVSGDKETTDAYIETLVAQAKKGNEHAITALGRLAIAAQESRPVNESNKETAEKDLVDTVLSKLYALYEIKQVEVHFAVGEAITAAVAAWDSDVVQLTLDVEADYTVTHTGKRTTRINEVLEKILTDCKATKPSLLKASGIWLFCIIQHCSHLPEIQSRLRECQVAFMRLLSARDELVQETASRGLSLVYEKGDPSLKDDLVRDLVGSFTGSGPQLKVDEDTELFDAGALPTGEGKSVTSYKDIVNLANEVGDQSLVYKFMSLAANAATWSTRSAFGRFGLSNILSESEVDPKLYPKLYRYRFDPNTNVQKSMNDIWKALVKDSNAVMEKHFDAIMTDLLKSILGREWRVREASCAAISDLVQGRPFPQYEKYYQQIWTSALKVLDDVKSSVREAALRLCVNLSNTLTRQLEEGGASAATTAMMNEALPFLLSDKGIESGVEDVKLFSTITVLKISKTGGKALRRYIPVMVPHLLGLLSTIEPDAINYHYIRAGEDNRDKIDKIRSQIVSQSPISEAIENCLRNIDSKTMEELVPGLENTIKTAIGMPTKIGCSRVLSTLATRHTTDFAPFSATFLHLMEKQALDRNDEVSQGYARAAAYIMRVAPSEAKQRFAKRYIDLYFTSEDESRRQKVADAVLFLSKTSPDHFNALESQLLPFSYLASHDTDEYVQKEFDEVWSTHAGSSRTVTRYVTEIVALVQRSLDTPQWSLKHGGALTVAAMVKAVTAASDLSGQVNVPNLKAIWPVFDKSLALKTFTGKEKLLEAFPDFVGKGKAFWEKDAQIAGQLKKIAVREAKRNNDAYRVHAFKCLWRFAAAREDLDMTNEIVDIVTPHLDELKDEDRMDVDKKDGKDNKDKLLHQTATNAVEAVARGYSRPNMNSNSIVVLEQILKVLGPYITSSQFDRVRREVWYKCVADLMEAAETASPSKENGRSVVLGFFNTLDVDKTDVGTEEQRSNRAKAAIAVAKALKKGVFGNSQETNTQVKETINKALVTERSLDVQRLLRDAVAEL